MGKSLGKIARQAPELNPVSKVGLKFDQTMKIYVIAPFMGLVQVEMARD
jgi:hypothetical protein